jgi:hypothetical protein
MVTYFRFDTLCATEIVEKVTISRYEKNYQERVTAINFGTSAVITWSFLRSQIMPDTDMGWT